MKASVISQYGGPEVLVYQDYPDPVPGPGQVLVRIAAAGVNPVDAMQRGGETREYLPITFPGVIGWDLSGTVEKIPAGVTGLAIGDRVMAWADHAYAELVALDASRLVMVPGNVDLISAAALPLASVTGSQLVTVASGIQAGQTILVTGAIGGVGRAAVFAAKELGAHVVAGVRRSQFDEAQLLEADELLALDEPDSVASFNQVDVIANTVRGAAADAVFNLVKDGGTFASATGAPGISGTRPAVKVVAFVSHSNTATLAAIAKAAGETRFAIPLARRLPLADAAEAHRLLQKGGAGRILLLP